MSDWIEIGSIEDIPALGARVVETPQGNIGIFRTADDEIFALRDECPHKKGPLSQGIVHGKRVTCPLHNWNIELDSGEAVAPDEGCAASFPVMVEGGKVFLSLS
jgi:nitrite reductase (NADH) small subunit